MDPHLRLDKPPTAACGEREVYTEASERNILMLAVEVPTLVAILLIAHIDGARLLDAKLRRRKTFAWRTCPVAILDPRYLKLDSCLLWICVLLQNAYFTSLEVFR